jgi:hypothetical protein
VLFPAGCGILQDNMANMKCGMDVSLGLRMPGLWSRGLLVLLTATLAVGCANSDKHRKEEPPTPVGGIPAPAPPAFLNGAMAVLLTNVEGFRAHVVLEGLPSANRGETIVGELMGRGGKLLFAPEPGTPQNKYSRVEDFSYIWNVDESRGFLLSGPLQGYAPISSNTRFTNVVIGSGGGSPAAEKVSGYLCQQSEVKVVSNDGAETVFKVWRAKDLKGLPVRITRTVNGTPLTLSFTKVRLETPPKELFLPPSDFTKYASAETMMNELVSRQQNLKRKRGWEPPPSDQIGNPNFNGPAYVR